MLQLKCILDPVLGGDYQGTDFSGDSDIHPEDECSDKHMEQGNNIDIAVSENIT
jgi:hypothetical protein